MLSHPIEYSDMLELDKRVHDFGMSLYLAHLTLKIKLREDLEPFVRLPLSAIWDRELCTLLTAEIQQ